MEKLTPQEEAAMQAVWQTGTGFIKDYLKRHPDPRPPYTTLASTLKNLQKKGFVTGKKYGVIIEYTPAISEKTYKKKFLAGFVKDYFGGSYCDLVAFLGREKKIGAAELGEIARELQLTATGPKK